MRGRRPRRARMEWGSVRVKTGRDGEAKASWSRHHGRYWVMVRWALGAGWGAILAMTQTYRVGHVAWMLLVGTVTAAGEESVDSVCALEWRWVCFYVGWRVLAGIRPGASSSATGSMTNNAHRCFCSACFALCSCVIRCRVVGFRLVEEDLSVVCAWWLLAGACKCCSSL